VRRGAAIIGGVAALLLAAGGVAAQGKASGSESRATQTVFVAEHMVAPDGKIVDNASVYVSGGKIERIVLGSAPQPGGAEHVVSIKGVLCPGLIDVGSSLSEFGTNVERTRPIDAAVSVVDAIDASDPALKRALHAGITAIMVSPQETAVVGGEAATIRTWPVDGRPDVLRADGPMVFSLSATVWSTDREPTSRAGAIHLLRDALAGAKAGKGEPRIRDVVTKKLDAIVNCETSEDVDAAVLAFKSYGVTPQLAHTADNVQIADDLADGTIVVVGPYSFGSSARVLRGAAALDKSGVRVAFSGDTPRNEGNSLRVSAALAVRYGMDPGAARRGMTAVGAFGFARDGGIYQG
jgi:imidazolonepropionase-like amidohydrolase